MLDLRKATFGALEISFLVIVVVIIILDVFYCCRNYKLRLELNIKTQWSNTHFIFSIFSYTVQYNLVSRLKCIILLTQSLSKFIYLEYISLSKLKNEQNSQLISLQSFTKTTSKFKDLLSISKEKILWNSKIISLLIRKRIIELWTYYYFFTYLHSR